MSKTVDRPKTRPTRKVPSTKVASVPAVKAKTLRLEPEYEAGLAMLKGVLGMPINKMVNEAVGEYIRRRTAEVETDLSDVLEQIRAYRKADPHFKQAWERFADAEARHGKDDPIEGVVVRGRPPAGRRRPKSGSTLAMIREILDSNS